MTIILKILSFFLIYQNNCKPMKVENMGRLVKQSMGRIGLNIYTKKSIII